MALCRSNLDSSDVIAQIKDRYRVRLFNTVDIPILCNYQQDLGDDMIVIDLRNAEGYEAKLLDAQANLQLILSEKSLDGTQLEKNKENCVPTGCALQGESLAVHFLSIKKLEKLAALNKSRSDENFGGALSVTSFDRFADFNLHLLSQQEALELINFDLSRQHQAFFDADLSKRAFVVFTEGNASFQPTILLGTRLTDKFMTSFKGVYLGSFASSIDQLELLYENMKAKFLLKKTICRCTFDVLKEHILLEKDRYFVPSLFIIEAEWSLAQNSGKGAMHRGGVKSKFLGMPPDNAIASVKFKPGWMDYRIELTDRINEVRYLAELAVNLKESTLPWTTKMAAADQKGGHESSDIVEKVAELVKDAKKELDSHQIYTLDFTDRLWDILKIAHSVDTLRRSFQLIYDALNAGEFRVLVESNKVSSLAKILRTRNPDEIVLPRLEPMTCLQLLVEIGVDRLNGEIVLRLLNGHFLSNMIDLEPFFLQTSAQIEQRIERLIPLYLALQSMMMFEEYVRFSQHEKTALTKKLLVHFTAMKDIEPFEKEYVYKTTMEDIRREKIQHKMVEWILERAFAKNAHQDSFESGKISDAFHITRNIGIKYIRPFRHGADRTAVGIIVKEENETQPPSKEDVEVVATVLEDENKQFECVYLSISSQPVGLFK